MLKPENEVAKFISPSLRHSSLKISSTVPFPLQKSIGIKKNKKKTTYFQTLGALIVGERLGEGAPRRLSRGDFLVRRGRFRLR